MENMQAAVDHSKFGYLPFVQTVVCAEAGSHPKESYWQRIWASRDDDWGNVEMWIARNDLKESFLDCAIETFGTRLMQVVRLGSYPDILYQRVDTIRRHHE